MKKQRIRINETQLRQIISESIKKCLNETDNWLTNTQIKNITGIQDDDELNLAAECEYHEEIQGKVWHMLLELSNGENPRQYTYHFSDICNMLKKQFNLKYIGADEVHECHIFKNNEFTLDLYPNMFYSKQGTVSVENIIIY